MKFLVPEDAIDLDEEEFEEVALGNEGSIASDYTNSFQY